MVVGESWKPWLINEKKSQLGFAKSNTQFLNSFRFGGIMRFLNLIQRPIFRPFSTSLRTILETDKHDPLTNLYTILSKSNFVEPELDRVAHNIYPEMVASVLMKPPNIRAGIWFFIWALRNKSLRAWEYNDLVVSMLLKDEHGFNVYWEILQDHKKCELEIPPDAFIPLISGYYEAGDAEKAVESFGKMQDYDCKPNVFNYNAVMYVMVKKDVVLLALTVYTQMLKFNCNPSVATYSILIDGLCKSGNVEDSLRLLDEMAQRGILPNAITYTIVLMGLCQAGRIYDAKVLLNKMKSSGCRLDWITCNGLLAGFCKLGMVDDAFSLLKFFENQGYVLGLNGYSCLIDGLFRVGRFDDANKWFHKLVEAAIVPDVVLYTIMIRGFCEAGKVKDAWTVIRKITDKGVAPDTQCYNTLMKGFCDAGFLEEAQSLKLEMSKNNCFPDTHTFTILICGLCRNGLVGDAQLLFEEMEKLGCFPSVVTFNALIDGLCMAGKLEEARLMFYKMEIGRNPSLFLRLTQGTNRVMDNESLQNMISGLCESGLYLKAYKLLTKLADTGVLPDIATYNILINGMCKSKNVDGAFKLLRDLQLKGLSPDSVTYGTLIKGLFRDHRDEEAVRMVEEMIKNGLSPSSSVYKALMTWSCRRKKVVMSFGLWLNYLRRVKDLDVEVIRMVEEYFQNGELEAAIRGLLKLDLELKNYDFGHYTIWLIGLCQARRIDDAMTVFTVLQEFDVTVTPPSCAKLIRCLCFERKLDLAANVFLYALEKGYTIVPRVCNLLLSSMLCSQTFVNRAVSLLSKMDTMGYDLDAHLSRRTKALWLHVSL